MRYRPITTRFKIQNAKEAVPIPIVSDAAIATPLIGDGRLIPFLILDTSQRPDVEEFIRIHQHSPPGDVETTWGALAATPNNIALFLYFSKPMEMFVVLNFDVERHGTVIDQILLARSLYIQAGKPGDRLIHKTDLPKVIIEVPETGFSEKWDVMYLKYIVKRMRNQGLSRHLAKRAAAEFIKERRDFGKLRVPVR